jgi:hypothetical protein
MQLALKTATASALALAMAAPASAQYYGSPYRPTDSYIQAQRDYQAQRDQYEAQRYDYANRSADYRAARAAYERRMADWEARRAAYDARYGYGSYVRVYGPAPVWDESRWAYVGPSYAGAPAAGYYGSNASAYAAPIRCNNNSAVTAGIIGALAGSVLGSNVASHGNRTEGAVLGGVVGAGVGAAIGHANDKYKCDAQGAYWSYSDTVPYRTSDAVYRDNRYTYYQRRGCRLAPAPVTDTDYRYVRVCPDGDGRYRITG